MGKKNKLTKAEQIELIKEGCKLDRRIKKAQAKLEVVKKKVQVMPKGTYSLENGNLVNIYDTQQFTEADPHKLYKWFIRRKKTIKDFCSVIKVKIPEAKKLMSEKAFEKFRKEKDSTTKVSFKTIKPAKVEASSSADDFHILKEK